MANEVTNFIDLENRNIYICGEITAPQISEVCFALITMLDKDNYEDTNIKDYERDPINIYITSYGGELDPSWGLIDIILNSQTPIYTYCLGCAYSAAFNIFLAGHLRFAYPHSTFLYHQLSTGTYGKFMDMYEKINVLLEDQKNIEEYVVSRTKITLEELHQNKTNKQDWYFNFDDAIKYGIVNGLKKE